jgi:hypothetical protein
MEDPKKTTIILRVAGVTAEIGTEHTFSKNVKLSLCLIS